MAERLIDLVTAPEREAKYMAAGLWDNSTLVGQLAKHNAARPLAVAVVDDATGMAATFADLERDSNRVAHFLVELGVQPGEVVALQLPNWYPCVAIAVGAMKAGAVVNPMLPIYREHELTHMLGVGKTRVIFTPEVYRGVDHRELVENVRPVLPELMYHLLVGPERQKFDETFGARPDVPLGLALPAASVSELMFTSGTEADPKAVMHTERTLTSNLRAIWKALQMSADDSIWMPAPIGHSTGFNHGIRMAIYHGLKIVLQDRWDAARAARLIETHRLTHTLLSTTFLRDLARAARDGAGDVSSLKLFGCGGSSIPPEAVQEADSVGINCLRLYGATEFLVATWNRPESQHTKRINTDGLLLGGVEIEIRDETGNRVVGDVGEIFVRSPGGSVGFFADDIRTTQTYNDGWIRSGDLGLLDRDQYLTMTGRKKDIFIRGGFNVAPREIEDLIAKIPGVRSVAVVGLPHARLGEIGCACVQFDEGTMLTLEEIVEHLRNQGLATFKLPERLVIVQHMPITATGKIRKHVLVAEITKASLAAGEAVTEERRSGA